MRKDVEKQQSNNKGKLGGVTGKGFLPGESGNPAGRPKKALCIPDLLRELSALPSKYDADKKKSRLRAICDKALDQAEGGDKDARAWVADRMEGKAIDRIITRDPDAEFIIR